MMAPFEYTAPAAGPYFIGRTRDCSKLCTLLREKRHLLLYGPPRTGKRSLLEKVLETVSAGNPHLRIRREDLGRLRDRNAENFLGTLFPKRNRPGGEAENNFPEEILWLYNFQDILLNEHPEELLRSIENELHSPQAPLCLFSGDGTGAMYEIFEEQKYFYGLYTRVELSEISTDHFTNYLIKGFLQGGKVIRPEQAEQICRSLQHHPWYIQHLAALCYEQTQGYLTEKILQEGFRRLTYLHEARFRSYTDSMTHYQLRFLKALLDGHSRMSTQNTIDAYRLGSSANVKRIREALLKKDIILIRRNREEMHYEYTFADPLFRQWLQNQYF